MLHKGETAKLIAETLVLLDMHAIVLAQHIPKKKRIGDVESELLGTKWAEPRPCYSCFAHRWSRPSNPPANIRQEMRAASQRA